MNREDIIRMAIDAGFSPAEIDVGFIQSRIARFARLVSEHVAAAERAAITTLIRDEYERDFDKPWRDDLIAKINARGQQ